MKSKILVADDSITIQKIVAMAFEHEDTHVEGIGNGEEAYNKLGEFHPDIVLADIDMPGLNGFELSKMIKESDEYQSIRVLLLASDFEEFDEASFQDCLADDHITKPFKSDDIIHKVKELLNASDSVEEPKQVEEEAIPPVEEAVTDEPEETPVESYSEEEEEAIELSADDLLPDDTAEGEKSLDELLDTLEGISQDGGEEAAPPAPKASETIDEMLSEVKGLKEIAASEEEEAAAEISEPTEPSDEPDLLAETDSSARENPEELDQTFQRIVNGQDSLRQEESEAGESMIEAKYRTERIAAEPEDLLKKIIPAASMASINERARPDLIKESLSYLSNLSDAEHTEEAKESHNSDRLEEFAETLDVGTAEIEQKVQEQVKRCFEDSVGAFIEPEFKELSQKIERSVREVVREIAPGIVSDIIKEEIEKIKEMD